MHKREDFHHSPEQANDAIAQARVLLDAHDLTPDERANLLPTLVTLLSSKQIFYEQAGSLPDLTRVDGAWLK